MDPAVHGHHVCHASRIAVPEKRELRRSAPDELPPKRTLALAFQTFTHAADSLRESPTASLQSEVLRLRFELERTNRDLTTSLEENARMRRYLARIVGSLPCGIAGGRSRGALRMMNPEARRLACH